MPATGHQEECAHSGSGIKPQGLEARGCDSSGRGGLDGKIELLEIRPRSSITAEGVQDEWEKWAQSVRDEQLVITSGQWCSSMLR